MGHDVRRVSKSERITVMYLIQYSFTCQLPPRLLTDILSRTVSELSQPILFKFSTLRVFGLPFVGLGATYDAVASLGWVTPGRQLRVSPLSFFPEKPGDLFFAHRCHYHYRFLLLSLGCHPLQVVTHTFFTCPTSFLHYSL